MTWRDKSSTRGQPACSVVHVRRPQRGCRDATAPAMAQEPYPRSCSNNANGSHPNPRTASPIRVRVPTRSPLPPFLLQA